MDVYQEKKNLLLDMIAYATVDGELDKKEFDFLFLLANTLDIERGGFMELFYKGTTLKLLKDQSVRILQFYRLAILMQKDGILFMKDATAIKQFSIHMGVNLDAVKKVLKKMKIAPDTQISINELLRIFKDVEYH
ncbi:excinuclease ABC subunit B [Flavobacterium sp. 7A]|uniref:excinuclease ABC subunit B n=1 Tax=Flavobacterium sp. 7A TaxID=2940571 RepID=UPI0022268DA1|nr:excinuclease ABC subunit B [Flavobacterium sp. 7A]MCW2119892.1 hypothetical protein [Flavobacterium sp. 7A]